ncbi:MAG: hypothetical protein NVSMB55_01340 [Mycobacteriales bacterium]
MTRVVVGLSAVTTIEYRPGIDPTLMRVVDDLGWIAFAFSGLGSGALKATFSLVVIRKGLLEVWVGWLGIAFAIATFMGVASLGSGRGAFSPQGSIAVTDNQVLPLWVAVVCGGAFRTSARTSRREGSGLGHPSRTGPHRALPSRSELMVAA